MNANSAMPTANQLSVPAPVEVMLVSVGGTPAPVIKSIEENRPKKLIFFASPGSYGSITAEILPAVLQTAGRILEHEIVKTPDEQDLGLCTFSLLRDTPAAMRKLGKTADWPDLVDFTGGTKVMSAAVVWASSRHPCRFSYVGANTPEARTKGGLGIVVNGNERCLIRENPWNQIAWFGVRDAAALFNAAQYPSAAAKMEQISAQISDPSIARLFTLILESWRGYATWDVFNHKAAIGHLSASVRALNDIAPLHEALWPGLTAFAEHNIACYEKLQGIVRQGSQSLSIELIHDLIANALRRIRIENKYDDGTARLYSAIEKLAKFTLKKNHGIDNSACRMEQIPDAIKEEFARRYSAPGTIGTLCFGLSASFSLLAALCDPLDARYHEQADTFRKLLPLRNNSILGHGAVPISGENAELLLDSLLSLLGITEAELVHFPAL